ncbi:phosphate butyryltransferase [Thermovirga sp.]|uniref:phosphate butyryltransferase n=1 Tax=Thermovirga sp. TaxID=2699834 RepID=UPI0025EA0AF5|nr:phosphate butyryltransferase [Thermovirga sp.]MBO8153790.1 phosphate butyryltransferase [Thermovirga sp.]MCD6183413.1 phosphate butyryltransferase [Thermovirga sp.]
MKQIKSLVELLAYAKEVGPKKISVALAEDPEVLEAVENARKEGVAEAFLVGNADKLKEVADSMGVDLGNYEVVDVKGGQKEISLEAVKLVSSGKADILMKGMISTANFLRGVLNKEVGLRTGGTLSHVYIHQVEGYDRLFFICDPAFNMYPDLPTKVNILNNTVQLAHAFGIEMPKVAVLAAVEVVNPDMPCTLDAAALSQMNRRKQIKGCIVDGPFALDNAISEESAKHKGIVSEVAGKADILLVPDIEAGNMMAKAIVYFSNNKTAGLVLGAKAPVVLTSRSDTPETKLLSIASAVALSVYQNK